MVANREIERVGRGLGQGQRQGQGQGQGGVHDGVVRAGIRELLRERLCAIHADDPARGQELASAFVAELHSRRGGAPTVAPGKPQPSVPAAFLRTVLGPHRKFSACWWGDGAQTLEQAELQALAASCERAALVDGQAVLELGCGWGSLSLWMAERYPRSRITAVCESAAQRAFIESEAALRGLSNLVVRVGDPGRFDTQDRFDRVVSVEACQRLCDWPTLFGRIARWLAPGGRFFMHVAVHRSVPYAFAERDAGERADPFLFPDGMMPSDDLALQFQDDLRILRRWRWDGTHYERTANAWLANLDRQRPRLQAVLEEAYGADQAACWAQRWRIFFMTVAELFGHDQGRQWWVAHYLFEKRAG